MTTTALGARPKESLFYPAVVYLIGKLTNFQPYVGIDHALIRDDVLRLAGFTLLYNDDDDSVTEREPIAATDGTYVWPLKDTSSRNRDGLYRVVSFAWYHQTRQYREECDALCCKPSDQNSIGKRGYWALTDLGAKKARALREIYEGQIVLSAGPNKTAKFLGENFDRLYGRITLHLRQKMARSEVFDKIDDHAMNWIERVIQRDGLRTRIEAGKSIPPSHVCAWARRGAYTDIRNEAREPVARVFYGALTPKEVREFAEINWTELVIPRTVNESDILCHNQYAAHSEDDYVSDPIESVMDTHESALVEDAVSNSDAFEHVLSLVSEIIADQIEEEADPEFHQQLVHDHFVKEMTVQEIAEAHGLDLDDHEDRIHMALGRIRDVMLDARNQGKLDEYLVS